MFCQGNGRKYPSFPDIFFRIYNGVKMQHILLHTEYDPGRENEELGGEEP
jgi:hypothetical protein